MAKKREVPVRDLLLEIVEKLDQQIDDISNKYLVNCIRQNLTEIAARENPAFTRPRDEAVIKAIIVYVRISIIGKNDFNNEAYKHAWAIYELIRNPWYVNP